jgi:glutathione S-transferase
LSGYVLYHCHDARSFRVLWALEELGLAYELRMLPFPPRFFKREYLKENPLGTIPLFIDGDTRMTESPAIIHYLATRHASDLAVRPDEPGYGAYLNALSYGEATLTFPQAIHLRYSRLEPEARRQPKVAEDYARWFQGRLVGLVQDESGHMAAGRFTGADISVGYALLLANETGLGDRLTDVAKAYFERMEQRPGFQRAMAAQIAAGEAQGVPRVRLMSL